MLRLQYIFILNDLMAIHLGGMSVDLSLDAASRLALFINITTMIAQTMAETSPDTDASTAPKTKVEDINDIDVHSVRNEVQGMMALSQLTNKAPLQIAAQ
ncbi:MAG TPA: hypothetical protein DCY55_07415 [Gammaproteobacteria bacterium]|nr:hypothetical protein [Pseudomonadota bacterium]HAY46099.1 hypothetical protein [Gammaproteobacteria bacterium]